MKLFNKVIDAEQLYFCSDLHIQHLNLCKGTSKWDDLTRCRDFENLAQMNQTVIDGINRVVPPDGILINLGDIIFGDKSKLIDYLSQINCKNHHYIFGNHDDWMMVQPEALSLFSSTQHYLQFFLKFPSGEKIRVCCSHYPISSWNDMNKGSWMIHGHCHQNFIHDGGKILDVGIDEINKYSAYSAIDILHIMNNRKILKKDHH